jgi:proteasome activator subunit 4
LILLLSVEPGTNKSNNGKHHLSSLGDLPQKVTTFLDKVALKLNATKAQTSDSLDKYRDTVLSWIGGCVGYHEYHFEKFIPLALVLHIDKSDHTKLIAKKILEISSQATIGKNDITTFLKSIISLIKENPSWHSILPVCHYLRIFVFQHSFYSESETHLTLILEIIDLLLSNNQFEVADAAKETLSSFIMVYSLQNPLIMSLITKYTELSQSKIQKNNNNVLHGLLGLSGLAKGQPYEVPLWLPDVLSEISNHLHSNNRTLRKIASEAMKEFWRTHQDEWVFWQHSFSSEQIAKIKQSTSPSYFA